MKKVIWEEVPEQGEFEKLPAGAYVAKVTEIKDNEDREYLEVIFDIAEGEHAGFYNNDFAKERPYLHNFYMSYKDTALGMLKGRLNAFNDSNAGFDAFAAFDAARLDMFKNRLIGILLREEEYMNSDLEIKTRLSVSKIVDAQKVREGKVKTQPTKELSDKDRRKATNTATSATTGDDYVPFN